MALLKHIYNNIMYAELNTKSDFCQKCGYTGEIQIATDGDGKLITKEIHRLCLWCDSVFYTDSN